MLAIAFVVVGLAGIVLFVTAPLVRPRRPAGESMPDDYLRALEEKDRALAALRELELDHRTGKITDGDYAALLGPLRGEAASALQAVSSAEGRG